VSPSLAQPNHLVKPSGARSFCAALSFGGSIAITVITLVRAEFSPAEWETIIMRCGNPG